MNKIVETLTKLERALGIEPIDVPENLADVVKVRKFTGTEFLTYIREEYAKEAGMSDEVKKTHREYLANLIALAKMAYVSDGMTQTPLPTVTDYTPTSMTAWRAYQVRLEPAPMAPPGQGAPVSSYKSEDGGPVPLTMDALKEAFDRMLSGAREGMEAAAEAGVTKALANLAGTLDESVEKVWKSDAAQDLTLVERDWDGAAAQARVFEWAGFDTDTPDVMKAREAHLIFDDEATTVRRGYKLPFADVVDGELVAVSGGIRAAASRLPQTDAPQAALDKARSVLDQYMAKLEKTEKSYDPPSEIIEDDGTPAPGVIDIWGEF